MTTTQTIRGIDEKVYREFRAQCVRLGKKTGDAITEAMKLWLKSNIDQNSEKAMMIGESRRGTNVQRNDIADLKEGLRAMLYGKDT